MQGKKRKTFPETHLRNKELEKTKNNGTDQAT